MSGSSRFLLRPKEVDPDLEIVWGGQIFMISNQLLCLSALVTPWGANASLAGDVE
jgi:hypothetical protein